MNKFLNHKGDITLFQPQGTQNWALRIYRYKHNEHSDVEYCFAAFETNQFTADPEVYVYPIDVKITGQTMSRLSTTTKIHEVEEFAGGLAGALVIIANHSDGIVRPDALLFVIKRAGEASLTFVVAKAWFTQIKK